eukprot:404687_1
MSAKSSHCCVCYASIEFRCGILCGKCSLLGCASSRREVEVLETSLQELRKEIAEKFLRKRKEQQKSPLFEKARNQSQERNDALRTLLLQAVQSVSHERWRAAKIESDNKDLRCKLEASKRELLQASADVTERHQAVLTGLSLHMVVCKKVLKRQRLWKALQAFVLLPIEVSVPRRDSQDEIRMLHFPASRPVVGVSTIAGLPLPNNGDYRSIPDEILSSTLCLVAKLISLLAEVFGICLPHALLPCKYPVYAAIEVEQMEGGQLEYLLCRNPYHHSSEVPTHVDEESSLSSMDIALDLLRCDVLFLCVEGGSVLASRLWPAEAILMNLWELQCHAADVLHEEGWENKDSWQPLPVPNDPVEENNNIPIEYEEAYAGEAAVAADAALHGFVHLCIT